MAVHYPDEDSMCGHTSTQEVDQLVQGDVWQSECLLVCHVAFLRLKLSASQSVDNNKSHHSRWNDRSGSNVESGLVRARLGVGVRRIELSHSTLLHHPWWLPLHSMGHLTPRKEDDDNKTLTPPQTCNPPSITAYLCNVGGGAWSINVPWQIFCSLSIDHLQEEDWDEHSKHFLVHLQSPSWQNMIIKAPFPQQAFITCMSGRLRVASPWHKEFLSRFGLRMDYRKNNKTTTCKLI